MKSIPLFAAILVAVAILAGCEGAGNPFTGSQWDIGVHHVSFSHAVADWDTANNRLELKFDLLSGATYPHALVTIDEVSTLTTNQPRDVDITVAISQGMTYECVAGDPDINATITLTRLDLAPVGGVSGTITGMARRVENPSDAPVALTASFENVVVMN